jgi:hypothetical protein
MTVAKQFTFKNPNILDGHSWPVFTKSKEGRYKHSYVVIGRRLHLCTICGVKRKKSNTWTYLVNGEWTYERPNCLRSVSLTAI